jgi:triosephosphate isomerase
LDAVRATLGDPSKAPIGLGAQNMYFEEKGAYTGEISAAMLKDLGCKYVILGHSERRHGMGETNHEVCLKVHVALNAGLTPIVCVGETLLERIQERTNEVIKEQFYGSLAALTAEQASRIVIAYEPVWAIGTGKAATPEQAQEVHALIRSMLKSRYNEDVSSQVRIQYGGSVSPKNADDLLKQKDIDGALVGGASLKADLFLGIIAVAKSLRC